MTLTVAQVLSDARRLGSRLRDHDANADGVISLARSVLDEVEAMRAYNEEIEHLNEVARNRPRAQLVLGIQQENRHIRALQQENKELRAALEEHQNAIELIMSKYRQHMSHLLHQTRLDSSFIVNREKAALLQDKTDRIMEMAGVMSQSIKIDDGFLAREEEIRSRLVTENKGLRDMLEISRKSGSLSNPLVGPKRVSRGCQTEDPPEEPPACCPTAEVPAGLDSSTAMEDSASSRVTDNGSRTNSESSPSPAMKTTALTPDQMRPLSASSSASSNPTSPTPSINSVISVSPVGRTSTNGSKSPSVQRSSSVDSDEDDSEDSEITFNTIKRNGKVNGDGLVEDGNTAVDSNILVDSNSDKNSKNSNGDIANGDIVDEGGGGGFSKDDEEQVASMES